MSVSYTHLDVYKRQDGGKQIVLNAPENAAEKRYVSTIKLNSKEYSKLYFNHSELIKGSVLDFKMVSTPMTNRKFVESDFPYSFSRENQPVKK